MYSNIPLWLSVFFIAAGLCLLTWSANRFVDGADAIAIELQKMPPEQRSEEKFRAVIKKIDKFYKFCRTGE